MSGLGGFLPLVVLAALFYLLLIRPQRNRQRQAQSLLSKLSPGDRVMTSSGMFGTVIEVEEAAVYLELAPGVDVRFVKGAIQRIVNPEEDAAVVDDTDPIDTDPIDTDQSDATGTDPAGTGPRATPATAPGVTAPGATAVDGPDGPDRDRS